MDYAILILSLFFLVAVILIMRLVGSWMFRINEVIKLQRDILTELRHLNDNQK